MFILRRLALFAAIIGCGIGLYAGEWRVEKLDDGRLMLANENGKFGGIGKGALYICGPAIHGKKSFPIGKYPEGSLAKAASAALRIYCCLHDYSWHGGRSNGLTEEISIRINGREMILKTNDPRFPAKMSKHGALRYRWVEIPFPAAWLDSDPSVVEVSKRQAVVPQDDYFYPGIDLTVDNTDSLVSTDRGKRFVRNWGNLKDDKGELMMRLLISPPGKRPEGETGSDFSTAFADASGVETAGGAVLTRGAGMLFTGKPGCKAVLTGTTGTNVNEYGLTLTAVMKFREDGIKKGKNAVIFCKDGAFFLARTGNSWNFSFSKNGKSWSHAVLGGEIPPAGEWFHLAATMEFVNESEHGNVGYLAKVFVNGELVAEKMFKERFPALSSAPIVLGELPRYPEYALNADVAEIGVWRRALSDGEVTAMAINANHVKKLPDGSFEVGEKAKQRFDAFRRAAKTPESRWLVAALERAAATGDDREGLPDDGAKLGLDRPAEELAACFNAAQELYTLYETPHAMLLMVRGEGHGCYPVAGYYDRRTLRDVFADRTWEWMVKFRDGKGRGDVLKSHSPGLKYKVVDRGGGAFEVTWSSGKFEAVSRITFSRGELAGDLRICAKDPRCTITEVTYPMWRFAPLPGKRGVLVYPRRTGVLAENPWNNFNYNGIYPCCNVSLQFSAIYNEKGDGVYFAFEDPMGRTKSYAVNSGGGALRVSWTHPVAYAAENPGGNGYVSSGRAVVDLFRGDWFDAGQRYKRFLPAARWWVEKLPRLDTPQWYREIPGWVVCDSAPDKAREFLTLREYFGVDVGATWVWWYDISSDEYPRYDQKHSSAAGVKLLKDAGVRVEAYVNPRLWGYAPRQTYAWQGRLGERASVKNENGDPVVENYGGKYIYPVACPGIPETGRLFRQNARMSVGYGMDSLYSDELAAARPHLCFDTRHGHPVNDPALWLEKGYWPLYEALRREFPDVPHNTEDACEVYAKCLDAFMPWRSILENQVPLFQSIFAGRVQFNGRAYDAHTRPSGDWQSFFSKAAEQLVFGEQIGWFHLNDLRYAGPRRNFARKMLNLRGALAETMNASEMIRFLKFREPVELIASAWSGIGGRPVIRTPRVLHSVWKRQSDGRIMAVFVNIVDRRSEASPILPPDVKGTLAILREGADAPEFVGIASGRIPAVELAPYAAEVWIIQPKAERTPEIDRISAVMKKLAAMRDGGPIISHPQHQDHSRRNRISAKPGEWVAPVRASWMEGCYMSLGYSTFDMDAERWIQAGKGSRIFWGEADFGSEAAKTLEIRVAADADRAGGRIIFKDAVSGKVMAEVTIPVTGKWHEYRTVSVPLKEAFTGKHDLITEFTGGCNIRSWRVVR